jgi:RNA polymerase sigma-70 factor (ECF subfamily)
MNARRGLFRPRLIAGGRASPAPAAGDQAARFRAEILPHLDAAYNLARYLVADPVMAEDIVQDAFLRAFRGFDGWRGDSPRAWLFAIVRNCWRDRIGAEVARRQVLVDNAALSEAQAAAVENLPDEADTPEASLIRDDEVEAIRRVIASIPEPFREALVLREMEGFAYREIATMTEVPIGTVMSRLARAREMLARLLLPHLASEPVPAAGLAPDQTETRA